MADESQKPKPRVAEPQRRQGVIRFEMPEDTLAATHPARVLWEVVGMLDLSAFLRGVKAVDGTVGRKTLSPRMKLTLWLYAISTGVGSAREIARLVGSDDGYRWIVGDLEVSHHTLSAFRVDHGAALDELMTDILASLLHKGVLLLELAAQDGIRIRAAATAPSFRRYESLLECREQAALHLKAVLAQADDPEITRAQQAAREAGARDFARRVEEAISTVTALQKTRKPSDKPARASTTDAEARVMKMADGGFRPAYNIRMATAGSPLGGPRTIVGVQVTNLGSDMGSITPIRRDPPAHGAATRNVAGGRQSRCAWMRSCCHGGRCRGIDRRPGADAARGRAGRRRPGDRGVARAHGDRGSQEALPGTCELVRADECPPAGASRYRPCARPRAGEGHLRRAPGGNHVEPVAARHDVAGVARLTLSSTMTLTSTLTSTATSPC
jgi:transposase